MLGFFSSKRKESQAASPTNASTQHSKTSTLKNSPVASNNTS